MRPETVRFYGPERELLLASGVLAAVGTWSALATLLWLTGATDGEAAVAALSVPALLGAWLLDRQRRRRAVLEVGPDGLRSGPVSYGWDELEPPRRLHEGDPDLPLEDADADEPGDAIALGPLIVPATDVPVTELAAYLAARREHAHGNWPGDPPVPPAATAARRLALSARRHPVVTVLVIAVPLAVALAGDWFIAVIVLLINAGRQWGSLMRETGPVHGYIAALIATGVGAALHPLI